MATQKQRRRRAKEKRHDYDLVYIDEDGVEQPVEREATPAPGKSVSRLGRSTPTTATTAKSQKSKGSATGRRGKVVQPPSWPRVLKRGAIFAPIFLVTVILLGGKKMSYPAAITQTILLIGVFIPFSYFMDRVVWRQQQKRLGNR